MTNSIIIPPCFIGENVTLTNAIVGPFVSLEHGSHVTGSIVRNSIIRRNVMVVDAVIDNSMLGERSTVSGHAMDLSLGDDGVIG
jgi:glucose-1-phosphate thymidylyltransferase